MTPMPDRCDAVVIGAGLGGLALAIRLQAAGRRVVLVEARDKPGGRAYVWHDKGHVFDAGPTVITDPAALAELWSLSGHRIGDDVQLVPVEPFYRLVFPDGSTFEYADDQARIEAAIRAINPADVEGYRRFLAYSREVMAEGYDKLGTVPFQSFSDMMRVAPQLVRLQAYRSVYAVVSRFIADPRLRQAFSFHSLLVGGAMAGMHVRVGAPEGYLPDEAVVERARAFGTDVLVTSDPVEAAAGADVLYTDVWLSMGDSDDERAARAEALRPYQVNAAVMAEANPQAVFMHCLPAHRGDEVSADVIDGPHSVVLDEAENRMHTAQALLIALVLRLLTGADGAEQGAG